MESMEETGNKAEGNDENGDVKAESIRME